MIIHDIEQGTDEWHAIREGKLTASHGQEISANGKGLETYIYKMLSEKYSSAERENYTNEHMERGNELEPIARSMYEMQESVSVDEVGFVELDEYTGASPDGFVGEDGGIEIKCHADTKHFRLVLNGEKEIESKYKWQCQMNMLITGRKWWDYVAYNPNFEQSLVIFRIEADEEKHEKLKKGLETGRKLIKEINKQYGK